MKTLKLTLLQDVRVSQDTPYNNPLPVSGLLPSFATLDHFFSGPGISASTQPEPASPQGFYLYPSLK